MAHLKGAIIWDITPCSTLDVNRRCIFTVKEQAVKEGMWQAQLVSHKTALFITTAQGTSKPTFACFLTGPFIPFCNLPGAVTLLKVLG
jgi:hypothetical protein